MRFIHNYLPAVAPHDHIYGDRPLPLSQLVKKADRRASHLAAFVYNCGHSANIVRPTRQSMRQTNDHFAHEPDFRMCNSIDATR